MNHCYDYLTPVIHWSTVFYLAIPRGPNTTKSALILSLTLIKIYLKKSKGLNERMDKAMDMFEALGFYIMKLVEGKPCVLEA